MKDENTKYNKTKLSCYLGFITQAIVANFTPLLFMVFHREYEVSIARLALIPAVFYIIQLITDFLCGDAGGTFGPSLVGLCTRSAGSDIQSGLLAASVFPVILVVCIKGITRERA